MVHLPISPSQDTTMVVSGIFAQNVVGMDGGCALTPIPPTVLLTMTWITPPWIGRGEVHTHLVPGTTEILLTIVRGILVSTALVLKAIILGGHLVGGQIDLPLLRLGALPTKIPVIHAALDPRRGAIGPLLRLRGRRLRLGAVPLKTPEDGAALVLHRGMTASVWPAAYWGPIVLHSFTGVLSVSLGQY